MARFKISKSLELQRHFAILVLSIQDKILQADVKRIDVTPVSLYNKDRELKRMFPELGNRMPHLYVEMHRVYN